MKSKTYHKGASDERSAVMAKVRRLLKSRGTLADLQEWLKLRVKRYRSRKGGL